MHFKPIQFEIYNKNMLSSTKDNEQKHGVSKVIRKLSHLWIQKITKNFINVKIIINF